MAKFIQVKGYPDTRLQLGPALAAGNTMVLKSSEKSPVAIAYLGKLANEAGFPPGVLNIITGFGDPAGQRLAEHPKIRKWVSLLYLPRAIILMTILGFRSPVQVRTSGKLCTVSSSFL